MLRELDKKLIEQESHRFDTEEVKTWLKPILESPIKKFDDLFKMYNLHEFTIHWYDGSPSFVKISCDLCEDRGKCNKCQVWKDWDGSEEQLTFNNWIDVEGPGIWGMNQKEVNKRGIETFKNEILQDEDFEIRTFYYQPPDDKYFNIFWYNRDRNRFDYWFVFEKKAGADLD